MKYTHTTFHCNTILYFFLRLSVFLLQKNNRAILGRRAKNREVYRKCNHKNFFLNYAKIYFFYIHTKLLSFYIFLQKTILCKLNFRLFCWLCKNIIYLFFFRFLFNSLRVLSRSTNYCNRATKTHYLHHTHIFFIFLLFSLPLCLFTHY